MPMPGEPLPGGAAAIAPGGMRAPRGPGPRRSERTVALDRYVETIYCIEEEGEPARPGRIAGWLQVTAPSVSIALGRLRARAAPTPELSRLSDLAPGRRATVSRISEIIEHEHLSLLRDLAEAGVRTGVPVSSWSDGEAVTCRVHAGGGRTLLLPHSMARLIWVESA